MTRRKLSVALVAFAASLSASSAWADDACLTTPDPWDAILHIDGLTASKVSGYIGMFNLYGVYVVGACITGEGPEAKLHAILDSNNNLLGALPLTYNHLCLTDQNDSLTVVDTLASVCGVAMYPLNYSGRVLVLNGQGGDDVIYAGLGSEIIYGGAGKDQLKDRLNIPDSSIASLYGESGNDWLSGGQGNGTIMNGGDGRDNIQDGGGSHDIIQGGYGNDCCIGDVGGFDTLDCGPDTDTLWSPSSRSKNCERSAPCSTTGYCL